MSNITPAQASAAHPKCGTCDHKVERSDLQFTWYDCGTQQATWAIGLDLERDYCQHHSELKKENNNE